MGNKSAQCALIDLCFKGESVGALNVLGGGRLLYWVAFTRTSCLIRASQPVGVLAVWKRCKMATGGEISPPLSWDGEAREELGGCAALSVRSSGTSVAFWSPWESKHPVSS